MKLATGSATDTGRVRGNNEDSLIVDGAHELFAVADGMGGHRGGEVASQTAIEALRAAVASGQAVSQAITSANDAVFERAAENSELTGMGTTLTAVVVSGAQELLVGHVGDSRAYLLHDGTLRRITDDHSLVEELVREGRLTPEQAESHPRRSVVTRAIGVDAAVEVDQYHVPVTNGDRVLICSDGLTTMVREGDVERLLRSEADPQRAAELLVDAANRAGGEDNTTVVVIDVLDVNDDAPAAAAPGTEDLTAAVPAAAEPAGASAPEYRPAMPAAPDPPPRPVPRISRGRRIRGALLLFVPLILVLAIAVGGVGYYARSSYYVGFDANRVVIYKGVPGGVLGWNPTIEQRTNLLGRQLTQIDHDRVAVGGGRGSLADAREFVAQLRTDVNATSTTTTTKPRVRRTTTTKHRSAATTTP